MGPTRASLVAAGTSDGGKELTDTSGRRAINRFVERIGGGRGLLLKRLGERQRRHGEDKGRQEDEHFHFPGVVFLFCAEWCREQ